DASNEHRDESHVAVALLVTQVVEQRTRRLLEQIRVPADCRGPDDGEVLTVLSRGPDLRASRTDVSEVVGIDEVATEFRVVPCDKRDTPAVNHRKAADAVAHRPELLDESLR